MSASQRDQWLIETTRETEPVPHSPIKRVQHSSTATWTPHRFPTFPTNLVGIGNYCGISRGSISSHDPDFNTREVRTTMISHLRTSPEGPNQLDDLTDHGLR